MKKKADEEWKEKRDRLKSLRDELEKKKKNLDAQRQAYLEKRETYLKINALLLVRRSGLTRPDRDVVVFPLDFFTSRKFLHLSQWGCSSEVERLLCMQEVPGSNPGISMFFFFFEQ